MILPRQCESSHNSWPVSIEEAYTKEDVDDDCKEK
jgi:hypothetical protein